MTEEELEQSKQEAFQVLTDAIKGGDTVQLVDDLLANPWFQTLGAVIDTVRELRECARYDEGNTMLRPQTEADIEKRLDKIRELMKLL